MAPQSLIASITLTISNCSASKFKRFCNGVCVCVCSINVYKMGAHWQSGCNKFVCTHTHTNAQARVCVHLVFFESICVAFNCAEPIIIDINVWREREGRMKYSKLSDMFSLHYLLDQKCLCACDMYASPSLSLFSCLLCSCDVWQTQCLQCLSNCWRWSRRAMLAKLLPESISANRLRGGWKLNLANVYFV